MARQKNKLLMFLFALIPGAGQMYMGFMKQGLSLMTLFSALCAVGIWLDLKPLLFFAPIILLYSFFDATNKNAMDTEAFRKLEDHYLWGDDWMDFGEGIKESISRRDGKKAMGTVMYVVAACMVWSAVKYFADILYGPSSLPGAVIAKIPVIVVAVFIFWLGHKLMKSASEDEKRFYGGMPYPYVNNPAIHMNGERIPNPWERVWREPDRRMPPPEYRKEQSTPLREEVAAAKTEAETKTETETGKTSPENSKVELKKETPSQKQTEEKEPERNEDKAAEEKKQPERNENDVVEENKQSEIKQEEATEEKE